MGERLSRRPYGRSFGTRHSALGSLATNLFALVANSVFCKIANLATTTGTTHFSGPSHHHHGPHSGASLAGAPPSHANLPGPHHFSPLCPCIYCQGAGGQGAASLMHSSDASAAAAAAAAAAAIMDPSSYSAYHAHPYYRVASSSAVKDFGSVHPHGSHHHSLEAHHHHHAASVSPSSVSSVAAQAAAVQTRILEMRKEKSRDAARSRRGKENHEFYELAKMLPLPAAITSQLDKASIIRLTISYLKLREFSQNGDPSWNNVLSSLSALKCKANTNVFESHQGTHILQSLDGFAFALGQDGRFLYISETVSIYLGLSQVEMTGSSVFDYIHQQDHAELAEQLGLGQVASSGGGLHQHSTSPLPPASVSSSASNESESGTHYGGNGQITVNGANDTLERQFCIRMKSTLTKRGCQHFKSSGYRVVHVVAHLRPEMLRRQTSAQITAQTKIIGLVAIAIALPPPSMNELRLEPDMFVTRHSLDFKIIHCEQRITDLLHYTPEEMVGRSIYSLVHGQDVILLKKCHLNLIHKGQAMSGYYRVINKSGGYTWMQTCATLICNNSNSPANANHANNKNNAANSTNPNAASTSGPSTGAPVGQEDLDQSVICVNYVLSAIEYTNVIMDSSQLGHKMLPSATVSVRPPTPTKMRSQQIKKSHSSTPSPETSKMASGMSLPAVSVGESAHLSQNSPQSHGGTLSRHRVPPPPPPAHSTSPLDHRPENLKRRRLNSSPVRPWKSPSPPSTVGNVTVTSADGNANQSGPNLLRHISVIRETPPILKPQVMAPSPYHAHHYHHLVDQYAAAYHLYKTSPNGTPISPQASNPTPHSAAHHWGAYG